MLSALASATQTSADPQVMWLLIAIMCLLVSTVQDE
jgi:hypothetical protein